MHYNVIVQARMNSNRLPGKVLRPILNKPLLDWVLRRINQASGLHQTIVATSVEASDDPVEEFCKTNRFLFYRGPLESVAQRFEGCLRAFPCDAFLRISADSPLIDPALIGTAISLHQTGRADIVTNVMRRTFPKGQSVELIQASTFLKAAPRMSDPQDLEHVTPYFYRHDNEYRIVNFQSHDAALSKVRLTIDTPEDYESLQRMAQALGEKLFSLPWQELAAWKTKHV